MCLALEDFFSCKNNANSTRVLATFIIIIGIAIFLLGITELVLAINVAPYKDPYRMSAEVGVGIWGSLPIIFTGILAYFLINRNYFTVKFLQGSALVSLLLFAPAVIVISCIKYPITLLVFILPASIPASTTQTPGTTTNVTQQAATNVTQQATTGVTTQAATGVTTQANMMDALSTIQIIAICLAVLGGVAMILLILLVIRLFCWAPDDGEREQLVTATKSQRVYATKDEFMVSSIPATAELNNGSSLAKPKALPVQTIQVPYVSDKKAQHVPFNAPPRHQMAMVQLPLPQEQLPQENYYVRLAPGNKVVTNMYPQMYKMNQ